MLRIIILLTIGLQTTYGQTFTGQVFKFGRDYLENKCEVILGSDCDSDDLIFLTDKQFCFLQRCIFNDVYFMGTYQVKSDKRILTFKQTYVSEIIDEQTNKTTNKRTNAKIESLEYKIS